jgi:hypothetical protein
VTKCFDIVNQDKKFRADKARILLPESVDSKRRRGYP